MQEYTRGDVEFLAMEIFHRQEGENRSWFTWQGSPSKLEYRLQARMQLEEPVEAVQIILEEEVVTSIPKAIAAPIEPPKKRGRPAKEAAKGPRIVHTTEG